jgi:hypothetical protein
MTTPASPTALDLLKQAESYLSALHGSVARHDNLAANLGCAGCELRDKIRNELAAVDWTDGHPQLEAIAAAVWEQCGRSDNGSCVEDDPRNIAVAALAAVVPPPTGLTAEEAYRLAVSAALRLGTGATWEAIRDRAEDLTAEAEGLTEARRRILDQQRATGESTDLPAILRWAADHLATIANATPGEDVRQPGMQDAIDRLRWLAVEAQQQTETPCCSDPTCACVQVNAAGRCDCARWDDAPLPIRYRNWRGETADRKILPIRVWFGATDWHPEPQWFLRAVDVDRGVERDFALADMHGLPAVVPAGAGEEPADETREAEAHPPTHTWKVESPRRDKWASWGATHDERVWAAASYDDVIEVAPQRPFRLVRATTTYAVEAEHQPAAVSQPGKEN